jgi:hypothetical protein
MKRNREADVASWEDVFVPAARFGLWKIQWVMCKLEWSEEVLVFYRRAEEGPFPAWKIRKDWREEIMYYHHNHQLPFNSQEDLSAACRSQKIEVLYYTQRSKIEKQLDKLNDVCMTQK